MIQFREFLQDILAALVGLDLSVSFETAMLLVVGILLLLLLLLLVVAVLHVPGLSSNIILKK